MICIRHIVKDKIYEILELTKSLKPIFFLRNIRSKLNLYNVYKIPVQKTLTVLKQHLFQAKQSGVGVLFFVWSNTQLLSKLLLPHHWYSCTCIQTPNISGQQYFPALPLQRPHRSCEFFASRIPHYEHRFHI